MQFFHAMTCRILLLEFTEGPRTVHEPTGQFQYNVFEIIKSQQPIKCKILFTVDENRKYAF